MMVGKTRPCTDSEEPPSVVAELEAMKLVLGSLEHLTLEVSVGANNIKDLVIGVLRKL